MSEHEIHFNVPAIVGIKRHFNTKPKGNGKKYIHTGNVATFAHLQRVCQLLPFAVVYFFLVSPYLYKYDIYIWYHIPKKLVK